MQFFVAVDQAMMPVKAFKFHAGGGESIKAHGALHGAYDGIHPCIAKHATEVHGIVFECEVWVEQNFKHAIHCLVEQAALDRVVVVLQEGADEFVCFFKLFQGQMDQQLQL